MENFLLPFPWAPSRVTQFVCSPTDIPPERILMRCVSFLQRREGQKYPRGHRHRTLATFRVQWVRVSPTVPIRLLGVGNASEETRCRRERTPLRL